MTCCLVTGGTGFVGSHLVESLVAEGHRVRVIDDLSTGLSTDLAGVAEQVQLFEGDLCNLDVVRDAMAGVEIVFHQAEPAPVGGAGENRENAGRAPGTDVLNVLTAARETGVRRVVYGSCASVYSDPASGRRLRETDPTFPVAPRGFAKLVGELHCVAFTTAYGLDTIRLRYFSVFGPRQPVCSPCAPVRAILEALLAGRRPVLEEATAREAQDLIYVGDVVYANLLAAQVSRGAGSVFNIARGRPATLLEVVAMANHILGTRLQPALRPGGAPGRGYRLADVSLAEARLGFCASTDLEQGLRHCLAYYQLRSHPAKGLPDLIAP
jgi:UDP-glucose 4-epimerase